MTEIGEVLVFVVVVGVLLVGGIRIGMLFAPRIGRLSESEEEGSGDDD